MDFIKNVANESKLGYILSEAIYNINYYADHFT